MLTKVILEGEFAKVAKKSEWLIDCNSPAEAIQMININCAGRLMNWIRKNLNNYKICEVECENKEGQKEQLDNDTFLLERESKVIRFLPIFQGAGGDNGILQAIVGVVLIVVGAVLSPYSGGLSSSLISAGVGLILGAICTALMSPSKDDDREDGSSYYFNGAVNTTVQGAPVPLVFGRCRVGSAVISATIDVSDQ